MRQTLLEIKERLNQIDTQQEEAKKEYNRQERAVSDEYYAKKRELEKEETEKRSEISRRFDNISEPLKNEEKILVGNMSAIHQKYLLQRVKEEITAEGYDPSKSKEHWLNFSNRYEREHVETIDLQLSALEVYIVGNDKPTNKYDLEVIPRYKASKISDLYGNALGIQSWSPLIKKSFRTKEEAKAYYDKNKEKISKTFINYDLVLYTDVMSSNINWTDEFDFRLVTVNRAGYSFKAIDSDNAILTYTHSYYSADMDSRYQEIEAKLQKVIIHDRVRVLIELPKVAIFQKDAVEKELIEEVERLEPYELKGIGIIKN